MPPSRGIHPTHTEYKERGRTQVSEFRISKKRNQENQMKKYIPILLCLTLGGCTTGSKTKTNINYYSNVYVAGTTTEPMPCESQYEEPQVIYREIPVEVIRYKTIYKKVLPKQASISDLGEELGRKMLRKMRAAYNES